MMAFIVRNILTACKESASGAGECVIVMNWMNSANEGHATSNWTVVFRYLLQTEHTAMTGILAL